METDINSANTSQSLPQTNQVPNQPIVEPKDNKLVKVLLFVVGAVVFMGIGAFGYGYFQNNKGVSTTPTTNLPTQTQPTQQVQPTTMPTSTQLGWKPYKINLYGIDLNIPDSWVVQEVNRRPEPTSPGSPIKGHDCADYKVKNNDGSVVLSVLPTCGFADGGADSWPNDAAIVKDKGNNSWIIRYFDSTKIAYIYSDAGQATISDEQGTRLEKTHASPPIIAIKKGEDLIFMVLELKYTGNEANKAQQLQIVDTIVASIK
jgi:hypothetical protein